MHYLEQIFSWAVSLPDWGKALIALGSFITLAKHAWGVLRATVAGFRKGFDWVSRISRWTALKRANSLAVRYRKARRCWKNDTALIVYIGRDVTLALFFIGVGVGAILLPSDIYFFEEELEGKLDKLFRIMVSLSIYIATMHSLFAALFFAEIVAPKPYRHREIARMRRLLVRAGYNDAEQDDWFDLQDIDLIESTDS